MLPLRGMRFGRDRGVPQQKKMQMKDCHPGNVKSVALVEVKWESRLRLSAVKAVCAC